jgi:hypothetical protein
MLAKAVASALAAAGLAIVAAVYPIYSLTPTPVLDFIARNLFNVGYLIYMTKLGRWLTSSRCETRGRRSTFTPGASGRPLCPPPRSCRSRSWVITTPICS